jgi:type II secretory pathway pseudopilin PulG
MRPLNRSGFLLVELLLGAVMLGILAATLVAVVRGNARVATRATHSLLTDRALLSLRTFAEEELRDATASDVTVLSPVRVALSRSIGEAIACADASGIVTFADQAWVGSRTPEGGRDDAWLLTDVVAGTWQRVAIDSVGRGTCPFDGAPGTWLAVPLHSGTAAVVRIVEPVELSAYPSGGTDWFGLTPASHASAVQPFAGPLSSATSRFGLTLNLLDIMVPPRGAPTTEVLIPLGAPE